MPLKSSITKMEGNMAGQNHLWSRVILNPLLMLLSWQAGSAGGGWWDNESVGTNDREMCSKLALLRDMLLLNRTSPRSTDWTLAWSHWRPRVCLRLSLYIARARWTSVVFAASGSHVSMCSLGCHRRRSFGMSSLFCCRELFWGP